MRRPGVAMQTEQPFDNSRIWLFLAAPPKTHLIKKNKCVFHFHFSIKLNVFFTYTLEMLLRMPKLLATV
jgi:hypothetical protein